jgi:hypothetical protein
MSKKKWSEVDQWQRFQMGGHSERYITEEELELFRKIIATGEIEKVPNTKDEVVFTFTKCPTMSLHIGGKVHV